MGKRTHFSTSNPNGIPQDTLNQIVIHSETNTTQIDNSQNANKNSSVNLFSYASYDSDEESSSENNWVSCVDIKTYHIYYWNQLNNKVQWEKPEINLQEKEE
ncbi:hypothetical protein WA158_005998 [Blastocystis sp. Blastoise]